MDGIRIAAALAALALGTGTPKDDSRLGAAPEREHKIACRDGTYVNAGADCGQHGGVGAPVAGEEGPARKSQPPNLRGHDTPAHASPYSAFGGKRQARDTSKPGKRRAVVKCADKDDPKCNSVSAKKRVGEPKPSTGDADR